MPQILSVICNWWPPSWSWCPLTLLQVGSPMSLAVRMHLLLSQSYVALFCYPKLLCLCRSSLSIHSTSPFRDSVCHSHFCSVWVYRFSPLLPPGEEEEQGSRGLFFPSLNSSLTQPQSSNRAVHSDQGHNPPQSWLCWVDATSHVKWQILHTNTVSKIQHVLNKSLTTIPMLDRQIPKPS